MPEVRSFEYATIRVVPKVEREEFLNVGVILYCPSAKFLGSRVSLDREKLLTLCEKTDIEEVEKHLNALQQISAGSAPASPIAKLDIASRFRWLTASRSTVVQSSKVHPGLCSDPNEKLEKLFTDMVL